MYPQYSNQHQQPPPGHGYPPQQYPSYVGGQQAPPQQYPQYGGPQPPMMQPPYVGPPAAGFQPSYMMGQSANQPTYAQSPGSPQAPQQHQQQPPLSGSIHLPQSPQQNQQGQGQQGGGLGGTMRVGHAGGLLYSLQGAIKRRDLPKVTPVTAAMLNVAGRKAAGEFHERLVTLMTDGSQRRMCAAVRGVMHIATTDGTATDGRQDATLRATELTDDQREAYVLAARTEFNHGQLPLCSSVREQITEVGAGCLYYFEFVKFLAVASFIWFVLQLGIYVKFADDTDPAFKTRTSSTLGTRRWFDDFSITGFQGSHIGLWKGLNTLAVIFTFFAAPLYYFGMRRRELREDADYLTPAGEEAKKDRLLRFNPDDCSISVDWFYRTRGELMVRRIAAVLIMLVFVAIQVLASFYITKSEESASIGIAFAVAIIAAVLSLFFKIASPHVTEMMKLEEFDHWQKMQALSIMMIRIGNLIAIFAAKDYGASKNTNCTYDLINQQFITMLLVEIIAANILALLSTYLMHRYADIIARKLKSRFGDQDNLPPFELADFYRNIVYRHFIAIMAMVVSPMTIGLVWVGYFLQYWVDKFMLFKLCGRPRKLYSSQKTFLTIILAAVALAALLTPYAGSMFMLSGITRDLSPLCHFP